MSSEAAPAELVVVFLKYPEPGRVKTRLAAAVGPAQAADIYRELVELTLVAVGQWLMGEPAGGPERHAWLYLDPPHQLSESQRWLSPKLRNWQRRPRWVPQPGGDLGDRLETVFSQGFSDGFSAVIAVGTDCPALSAASLSRAATHLGTHPGVIGPSADGGYYLIGVNSHRPELFRNIPWSSSQTRAATLAAAHQSGLSFATLPTLADIDTHQDWKQWRGGSDREVSKNPATKIQKSKMGS